jgi:hypothetical protein
LGLVSLKKELDIDQDSDLNNSMSLKMVPQKQDSKGFHNLTDVKYKKRENLIECEEIEGPDSEENLENKFLNGNLDSD